MKIQPTQHQRTLPLIARARLRRLPRITQQSCRCQAKNIDQLQHPARIGARCKKQTVVKEITGYPLDAYMRLPVEQYYELDPSMIKPVGNNRFQLLVPRIQLFNVWLEPIVEVHVTQQGDEVIIQAVHCQLQGSDFVTNMHLDSKFVLQFRTVLTWTSPAAAAQKQLPVTPASVNGTRDNGMEKHASASVPSQLANMSDASATSVTAATVVADGSQGIISADLDLHVWCEVIPPFNVLPRDSVLQPTVNAVLAGLVRTLLPVFVRRLGSDYERWASDEAYRIRRARLSQESQSRDAAAAVAMTK